MRRGDELTGEFGAIQPIRPSRLSDCFKWGERAADAGHPSVDEYLRRGRRAGENVRYEHVRESAVHALMIALPGGCCLCACAKSAERADTGRSVEVVRHLDQPVWFPNHHPLASCLEKTLGFEPADDSTDGEERRSCHLGDVLA